MTSDRRVRAQVDDVGIADRLRAPVEAVAEVHHELLPVTRRRELVPRLPRHSVVGGRVHLEAQCGGEIEAGACGSRLRFLSDRCVRPEHPSPSGDPR